MKFIKKVINSQTGLSLIEVTLGAAMAIGVAMMVMKTGQISQKTQKKAQSESQLSAIKEFFRSSFNVADNCRDTFVNEGINYLDTTIGTLQADAASRPPGFPVGAMPRYHRYSEVAPDPNVIDIEAVGGTVTIEVGETADPIPGFPEWTLTELRIYQLFDGATVDNEGLCPIRYELRRNVGASSKRSFGAETVIFWSVLNCTINGGTELMTSCVENRAVMQGFWSPRTPGNPADGIEYDGSGGANVHITNGGNLLLEDGGYVSISSDERIKKEIVPIENSSDKINELNGFYYFFRQEEFPYRKFPEERQVGVIAQEVERILPEAVHTTRDGTKTVNYTMLIPVLIEAHKEQDLRIKELERKIDKLLEEKK